LNLLGVEPQNESCTYPYIIKIRMRGLERAGCKDEFSAISWVKNTGHGNGSDAGKTLHGERKVI
jgi:hypothetical protein